MGTLIGGEGQAGRRRMLTSLFLIIHEHAACDERYKLTVTYALRGKVSCLLISVLGKWRG